MEHTFFTTDIGENDKFDSLHIIISEANALKIITQLSQMLYADRRYEKCIYSLELHGVSKYGDKRPHQVLAAPIET